MIAQIHGRLLRKGPQEAIVDVGGVGYRLTIPLSTFYRVGEPGAEVTLLTHTHVREDTLALFGFLTAVEQALFERLIAVSGVGPKLAVSVLSGIEAPELVAALRSGDVARLTRIPGVGKKTAERLVVELKDKMKDLALGGGPARRDEPGGRGHRVGAGPPRLLAPGGRARRRARVPRARRGPLRGPAARRPPGGLAPLLMGVRRRAGRRA